MLIIQFVKLNHVDYMNYLVPIMTSIAIISSTLNYIINPGIIYSSNKVKEKVHCASCKMLYPKMSNNIVHCGICEICINGYDFKNDTLSFCCLSFILDQLIYPYTSFTRNMTKQILTDR